MLGQQRFAGKGKGASEESTTARAAPGFEERFDQSLNSDEPPFKQPAVNHAVISGDGLVQERQYSIEGKK